MNNADRCPMYRNRNDGRLRRVIETRREVVRLIGIFARLKFAGIREACRIGRISGSCLWIGRTVFKFVRFLKNCHLKRKQAAQKKAHNRNATRETVGVGESPGKANELGAVDEHPVDEHPVDETVATDGEVGLTGLAPDPNEVSKREAGQCAVPQQMETSSSSVVAVPNFPEQDVGPKEEDLLIIVDDLNNAEAHPDQACALEVQASSVPEAVVPKTEEDYLALTGESSFAELQQPVEVANHASRQPTFAENFSAMMEELDIAEEHPLLVQHSFSPGDITSLANADTLRRDPGPEHGGGLSLAALLGHNRDATPAAYSSAVRADSVAAAMAKWIAAAPMVSFGAPDAQRVAPATTSMAADERGVPEVVGPITAADDDQPAPMELGLADEQWPHGELGSSPSDTPPAHHNMDAPQGPSNATPSNEPLIAIGDPRGIFQASMVMRTDEQGRSFSSFRCNHCFQLFQRCYFFLEHYKRRHERLPCKYCGNFLPLGRYTRHIKNCRDNNWSCLGCERVFSSKRRAETHMVTVHGGLPCPLPSKVKCPRCTLRFTPASLLSHTRNVHPEDVMGNIADKQRTQEPPTEGNHK